MAAFALSRYAFRGREVFYTLFITGLLFPIGIAALPLFLQLQLLGLLDNQFGVALPEAAFSLPITMLILRPFMRAIPGDLEDAALVDGAGRLYQSTYSSDTAIILAFTALAAVPALGVFMFAERYLVAGAAGAVKG